MLQHTRWIFTIPFLLFSVGVMLSAVMLVATHFETFRDKLPAYHEFFTFGTVINLWIALGLVKIIHEFGHGLAQNRLMHPNLDGRRGIAIRRNCGQSRGSSFIPNADANAILTRLGGELHGNLAHEQVDVPNHVHFLIHGGQLRIQ